MRKKIEWQWEILDEYTKRAKTIGGWLVHHASHANKNGISESMCFVADRDHEWTIVAPYKEENKPTSNVAAGFKVPDMA